MIRILSCLVSYRDPQKLLRALEHQARLIIPSGVKLDLYVFDNSEKADLLPALEKSCQIYGARLVVMPENLGVSGAYFEAAKIMINQGHDFLWFWDQDSEPETTCLIALYQTFLNEKSKTLSTAGAKTKLISHQTLGVVLPRLHDETGTETHWSYFGPPYDLGKMKTHRFPLERLESGEISTTFMVNSGALVARKVIETVGAPDPGFFMDIVDCEFGSRVVRAGFRMVINGQAIVLHQVGNPVKHRLLGRDFWSRNYPIFRYYYQAKNEMLLAHASGSFGKLGMSTTWRLLTRSIKFAFERDHFWPKLCAHFLGWYDGLRGLKGKTHPTWMMRRSKAHPTISK